MILLLLAPLSGLVAGADRRARRAAVLLACTGWLLPLVADAVASVDPRYVLPAYGPLAAATAIGLQGVWERRGTWARRNRGSRCGRGASASAARTAPGPALDPAMLGQLAGERPEEQRGCSAGYRFHSRRGSWLRRYAHSRPDSWSQFGACGTRPAWKSNAAPTPTSSVRLETRTQSPPPLLLLGYANPDPHHIGVGAVDLGGDRRALLLGQLPVRRAVTADDPDPRNGAGGG